MAEYISKERAKDLMGCCLASAKAEYKAAKDEFTKARFGDYISSIQSMIDVVGSVEAADVQPVVRCKDCKHRKEHHYEESGEKPYIKYECKFTGYSMSDDGFCSFGARMDLKGGDIE